MVLARAAAVFVLPEPWGPWMKVTGDVAALYTARSCLAREMVSEIEAKRERKCSRLSPVLIVLQSERH